MTLKVKGHIRSYTPFGILSKQRNGKEFLNNFLSIFLIVSNSFISTNPENILLQEFQCQFKTQLDFTFFCSKNKVFFIISGVVVRDIISNVAPPSLSS